MVKETDAPVSPELDEPVSASKAPVAVAVPTDEQKRLESDQMIMKRVLAAQPKVQVKVAEDTLVSINGYQLLIQGKTKVMVPQQVADLLEEAGRI